MLHDENIISQTLTQTEKVYNYQDEQTFYQKYEFSIKFCYMLLFALYVIIIAWLLSEFISTIK